jgi:hypothetical protein
MATPFSGVTFQGSDLGSPGSSLELYGGKKPWKHTQIPQLWAKFMEYAAGAGGPLQEAYQAQLRAIREGLGEQYRQTMAGGAGLAEQGVNPAFAQQLQERQASLLPQQAAQQQAGAEGQYQENLFGLYQGGTNAITGAVQNQAQLDQQYYMWQKAQEQQKSAAKFGKALGVAGLLLSIPSAGASLGLFGAGAKAASGGMQPPQTGPLFGMAPSQSQQFALNGAAGGNYGMMTPSFFGQQGLFGSTLLPYQSQQQPKWY